MNDLASIALEIGVAIAVPLVSAAVYQLAKKGAAVLHLQLTSAQDQQLQNLAADAALVAEEWAAAKFKAGVSKPTGDDKMNHAITHLTTMLPGLTDHQAQSLIRGALVRVGLGAIHSLGRAA